MSSMFGGPVNMWTQSGADLVEIAQAASDYINEVGQDRIALDVVLSSYGGSGSQGVQPVFFTLCVPWKTYATAETKDFVVIDEEDSDAFNAAILDATTVGSVVGAIFYATSVLISSSAPRYMAIISRRYTP